MNKSDMTKEEWLDYISFSNLVKAIDAKWGHTYEDVPVEDEITIPEYEL